MPLFDFTYRCVTMVAVDVCQVRLPGDILYTVNMIVLGPIWIFLCRLVSSTLCISSVSLSFSLCEQY